MVPPVLCTLCSKDITCFAWHHDSWCVLFHGCECCICQLSSFERIHWVCFAFVWNHVEHFVSGCHLLWVWIPNWISTYNLTCCFGLVGGEISNERFSTLLPIIDNVSSKICFKCHLHRHSSCFSLSWIFGLEFFHFYLL